MASVAVPSVIAAVAAFANCPVSSPRVPAEADLRGFQTSTRGPTIARFAARRVRPPLPAPNILEHAINTDAHDALHRVKTDSILLAIIEDRHDVGVVKLRRRPCFGLKSSVRRSGRRGTGDA